MPGREYNAGNYRYGFNGKEKDDELNGKGNTIDFGDRIYDSRVGRFLSIDPLYSKFPFISPFSYAGNRPISAIDVKGDSVYILFYTENSSMIGGEDMFRAAALTRSKDIKNSGYFDPARDKVVIIGIQDISKIKLHVSETVKKYSGNYGQTVEFDIWSHASFDGPVGTIGTTENSTGWGTNQMNLKGWGEIDFNWSKSGVECRAMNNGCRTGEDPPGTNASFVTELSALTNFKNVIIQGPSTYSEPSKYVDNPVKTGTSGGNRIIEEKNSIIKFYKTYMIPVHSTKKEPFKDHDKVQAMRVSINGKGKLQGVQTGDKTPK
ncbi:MAG: hypothetical protein H7296_14015 [Bacteroidia bacterium]|nr:hypothetical protein [Bacteroidia bacterium]